MTSQFWFWLDTIAMLIGGAAILAIGKRRTASEEAHTIYHGIVPIIAACSYLAMAAGQGAMALPVGVLADPAHGADVVLTRTFYFARYLDWSFTTPLLLLPLALTATHGGLRRGGLISGLLLADLMMILTALFFGLSVVDWIKWTWFLVSCVAFLAVYWVMFVPLMQEASKERDDVRACYRTNALILAVLWFIYPIILLFSTDGLGVFSSTLSVALVAIIDLVSKVIYGLYTIKGFTGIVDRDLGTATAGTARPLGATSAVTV